MLVRRVGNDMSGRLRKGAHQCQSAACCEASAVSLYQEHHGSVCAFVVFFLSLSLLPFASKALSCRRQRAAACLFPAGEESSGEESGSGCEFQQCSTEFEFNATEVTGSSNKSDKKVNTSAAPSSGLSQAALFLSVLVLAMQRQWR